MRKHLGFDLILLGAPTSGKDTQAILLEKKFALKPVESGKYLRAMEKEKTNLAQALRKNLFKGLPAPVQIIENFLDENIRSAPKHKNLIFIGNPRLKPEAEHLRKLMEKNHRDFLALYLTLPVREIYRRSALRLRNEDDSVHVGERIKWHKIRVGKTVKYFQKLKKLIFINGNQSIKKVNRDILKALDDYQRPQTN